MLPAACYLRPWRHHCHLAANFPDPRPGWLRGVCMAQCAFCPFVRYASFFYLKLTIKLLDLQVQRLEQRFEMWADFKKRLNKYSEASKLEVACLLSTQDPEEQDVSWDAFPLARGLGTDALSFFLVLFSPPFFSFSSFGFPFPFPMFLACFSSLVLSTSLHIAGFFSFFSCTLSILRFCSRTTSCPCPP